MREENSGGKAAAPAQPDRLVWGKNPVTALLKSGTAVDTVLLADTLAPAAAGYYTALAKEAGAVIKRVPGHRLQKLCGTAEHQGVAAWAAAVEYAALEDLLAAAAEKGEPPFLVLCDGIEDPHNLGAVLRSAFLCGAHGAVIPKRRRSGPAAGGAGEQLGAGHPHAQGAGCLRLLRRPWRRAAGAHRPFRPGGAGAGQRRQGPGSPHPQTVRRRGDAGHGPRRPRERHRQLQRERGGRYFAV